MHLECGQRLSVLIADVLFSQKGRGWEKLGIAL